MRVTTATRATCTNVSMPLGESPRVLITESGDASRARLPCPRYDTPVLWRRLVGAAERLWRWTRAVEKLAGGARVDREAFRGGGRIGGGLRHLQGQFIDGFLDGLQIGYGSNKKTIHMAPSGHKSFLVQNPNDVELLLMHNRTYAAE